MKRCGVAWRKEYVCAPFSPSRLLLVLSFFFLFFILIYFCHIVTDELLLDIPLPTAEDREQLLKINLREVNVDADVGLQQLSGLCEGYPLPPSPLLSLLSPFPSPSSLLFHLYFDFSILTVERISPMCVVTLASCLCGDAFAV